MVITEPNKFVREVQDKDFEQWEAGNPKDAAAPMKPAGEDVLQRWPVSKRVNSSKADDSDATPIDKVELDLCSTEYVSAL